MSFDTIGIVVFLIALLIFLFIYRKKIVTQKILFPIIYISMLKTKLGLNLMDKLAKKYAKQLRYIGYVGILIGFLGMIFISFSLLQNIYNMFTKPQTAPGVGIVLPIEAKGVFFVPFFYWIISIFVIAVIHEFAHGVFIRLYKVKVKSSGFAVLNLIIPVIPAAFVEPDEKKLVKKSVKEQLSIYAAGPFSNITLGFIILLLSGYIVGPAIDKIIEFDGVIITGFVKGSEVFSAEKAGIKEGEIIKEINGKQIMFMSNFTAILQSKKPGESMKIKTDESTYKVTLVENPEEKGRAYLGVYVKQGKRIKEGIVNKYGNFLPALFLWFVGLLYWLYVLNLGIGLFNLVPIGPIDGGRMLKVVLENWFEKKSSDNLFKFIGVFFLAVILINLLAAFR